MSAGAEFDSSGNTPTFTVRWKGPVAAAPNILFHGMGVGDVFLNLLAAPVKVWGPLFATIALGDVSSRLEAFHGEMQLGLNAGGGFTITTNVYQGSTLVKT